MQGENHVVNLKFSVRHMKSKVRGNGKNKRIYFLFNSAHINTLVAPENQPNETFNFCILLNFQVEMCLHLHTSVRTSSVSSGLKCAEVEVCLEGWADK